MKKPNDEQPKAKTLEINKLRKSEGLRYRITAMELTGGEFAATIQLRSALVRTSVGPYLTGSVSLGLIEILEQLRTEEAEHGEDHGVD